MNEVIFARTRHEYGSYKDFWQLVTLSGFPVVFIDEIDPRSANTYIITPLNGEWNHGWENPTARLIWWDLEWRINRTSPYPEVPGVSEIWASDAWYARQVGAKYVLLGSHTGIASVVQQPVMLDKRYDVALMCYREPHRRAHMIHRLETAGIRIAPNGWDAERDRYLKQSRAMLHIHQHDGVPTVAPLRWALAAAYGLPLITETVTDRAGFDYGMLLMADYELLPDFVRQWTQRNDPEILESYGHALHNFLCQEHDFRSCVERAL